MRSRYHITMLFAGERCKKCKAVWQLFSQLEEKQIGTWVITYAVREKMHVTASRSNTQYNPGVTLLVEDLENERFRKWNRLQNLFKLSIPDMYVFSQSQNSYIKLDRNSSDDTRILHLGARGLAFSFPVFPILSLPSVFFALFSFSHSSHPFPFPSLRSLSVPLFNRVQGITLEKFFEITFAGRLILAHFDAKINDLLT